MLRVPLVTADDSYMHEVGDDNGLPVKLSHGLNIADDAVLCYPAGNNHTEVTFSVSTIVAITTATIALLAGYSVNTAIASTAGLIQDGDVTVFTIPVGTAAGTDKDCHNTIFLDGINVTTASVAGGSTGAISLFWVDR
jgi:hypothetical protein